MSWVSKHYSNQYDWHKNFGMRARFIERWYHRFVRCPYQFNYDIEIKPEHFNLESDISCTIEPQLAWLKAQACGRIHLVLDYQAHSLNAFYQNLNTKSKFGRTERLTLAVAFSNKKLALLWKLTWGGKMVDGRRLCLKLKI